MTAEQPPHLPVVGGQVWRPVMYAAGYRCQCTGTCGRAHAGGRCEHLNSRGEGRAPLLAAPADPALDPVVPVSVGDLRAWCVRCYVTTRGIASRAAAAAAAAETRAAMRGPYANPSTRTGNVA